MDGASFAHLGAALLRQLEAKREEHDLADECVVGDHHCHRPEQRRQGVGQGGAAGVAGVHCDEHAEAGVEGQLGTLEEKLGVAALQGELDGGDLLADHGQDFDVDSVEFVEAGPGSA